MSETFKSARNLCFACFLCAVMPNTVCAQSLSMASDPTALAKAALGTNPGVAVVGILRDGKEVYGMASNSSQDSISNPHQVLFEIGSISKVFTGLLLAQAVEHGELSLDDNLGKLLKDKANLSSSVAAITLKQLITHSSCLPRMPANFSDGSNPYRDYGRDQLWEALASLKLESNPPCEATYSNFGVAIVGELLSERYHKPWDVLVRERITGPLGMNDTLQFLGDKATRLTQGYNGSKKSVPWDFLAFSGAGGLRSTAADMLIFSRAILAGKDGPLGASVERLVTPLGKFQAFGIGYAVLIRGPQDKRTFSHNGGTEGYSSLWMVAPDTQQALVILASNMDAPIGRVTQSIIANRYPVSHDVVPIDVEKLHEYAGVFRTDKDLAFTFVVQDGALYGRVARQQFKTLTSAGNNTFTFSTVGAQFTFSGEGEKITSVTLNQGGAIYTAKRTNEPVPTRITASPRSLEAYIGHYRKTRLFGPNMEFDVQANAGQLTVKLNSQPRYPVFPVEDKPDRFYYDVVKAELQFERDANGKVIAVTLHQNGEHRAVLVEN